MIKLRCHLLHRGNLLPNCLCICQYQRFRQVKRYALRFLITRHNKQHVWPQAFNLISHVILGTLADTNHRDDRGVTNHNAQHRQTAANLVGD